MKCVLTCAMFFFRPDIVIFNTIHRIMLHLKQKIKSHKSKSCYNIFCSVLFRQIFVFESFSHIEWVLMYLSNIMLYCFILLSNSLNQVYWLVGLFAIYLSWELLENHWSHFLETQHNYRIEGILVPFIAYLPCNSIILR